MVGLDDSALCFTWVALVATFCTISLVASFLVYVLFFVESPLELHGGHPWISWVHLVVFPVLVHLIISHFFSVTNGVNDLVWISRPVSFCTSMYPRSAWISWFTVIAWLHIHIVPWELGCPIFRRLSWYKVLHMWRHLIHPQYFGVWCYLAWACLVSIHFLREAPRA